MLVIILQFIGIVGIFTDNLTLMIMGLITAFLFCFCQKGTSWADMQLCRFI